MGKDLKKKKKNLSVEV